MGDAVQLKVTPYGSIRLRVLTAGDYYRVAEGQQFSLPASRQMIRTSVSPTDPDDILGSYTIPDFNSVPLIEAVFQGILPTEPRRVILVVTGFDANGRSIDQDGGTATVSKTEAMPGEEIRITATPEEGFVLDSIEWGSGATIGKDIKDSEQ